jgi:hypothetical protein
VLGLCIYGRTIWGAIYSTYLFFFDYDYVFGCDYSKIDNPPRKKMPEVETKCCSLHEYEYLDTLKHKWIIDSKGQPLGYRIRLDDAIRGKREKPGHTETELEVLLNWKKAGNDIVFTSWNRWRCKKCGDIKATEFYALAGRSDREFKNLILDLNERKKHTQPLPGIGNKREEVNGRREIPVEPMKKY